MPSGEHNLPAVPRLHLITPDRCDDATAAVTARLLAGGAPLVQVRCKQATDRQRLQAVRAALEARRAPDQLVLVDDRADVACAAGADGVHVGDEDLPVPAVRSLVGHHRLVGATARTPEAARARVLEGAHYLGVGPVRESTTKVAGLPAPIGLDGLAAVAAAVPVPVIAIAGIEVGDVADVRAAGAHGVAVCAAVYGADDPPDALAAFLDALGAAR
ncbi:MAG: thiamine phosphate synthase [Acidimicrobiales bacterium]|nr:thiamine phosphate synthase [Acidimicrobiales bacterium]MCB1259278.1 thiamine phosphate synthase [Acidimicrobiales bacterium]